MLELPKTATAPFCPSEVRGSVAFTPGAGGWRKFLQFAGPGLLVSVGYMDPGNWATDIEAGSRFGYGLLSVVVLSSLAAMLLQTLALRLGLATGRDLAQLCGERYRPGAAKTLWILAELGIIATDLAEVLGSAVAFHLLLGVPLATGVALTALDTAIILALKGQKFRELEAIMLGLVATIGLCYLAQVVLVKPAWPEVARGLVPSLGTLAHREPLYLAVGILGATVMPHNLYLHSSIVLTRQVDPDPASRAEAIRWARLDNILSLSLAMVVNVLILVLASAVFHAHGRHEVASILDAHRLLAPILGTSAAGVLFAVSLLAAGQSSTFTGTVTGQVILEGFVNLKIPCWQRRLATRALALLPALAGIAWLGEGGAGKLLVLSQVALSLQLPFALWPLIRFTGDPGLMGPFVNRPWVSALAWTIFAVVTAANLWLVAMVLG
ncbi:Nramp family divalent metal transporter [Mesoterricola sediminis]|uniref:Divalent metal cation transporter MntH n=1 Tax=Mesoterricola sediminis TaxID=2927980 RepID=A0AA48KES7_9BACT|nr:Nramp family divalent metal transporter [Mesoterricola sediminis]BDU77587.1 divalent metal cation transporter MntH 1 [Mesoterricola sediminis]